MTFTKEQLIARARFLIKRYEDSLANYPDQDGVAMDLELARMALEGMEAELVVRVLSSRAGNDTSTIDKALPEGTMLYAAPQPLTTSERAELENYRNAQQVVPVEATSDDCPAFIKYDVTEVDEAWARGFNACRAAMLQGAEHVTTAYKLPKPIKDHRLNSGPDADDYYAGYQAGWNDSIGEAVICNSSVIPDGWVACSERMPEAGDDMIVFTDDIVMSGISYSKKKGFYIQALEYDDDEPVDNVTHWMPLPTAPRQRG